MFVIMSIITGVTAGSWNHIKLVLTSGTSLVAYVNGGSAQTHSTNIPTVATMYKEISFGVVPTLGANLNGYIQDVSISPTADTSTDHYDNGLPYYNPNKMMGKNANWAIDNNGNIAGLPQVAGIIVDEYELSGQHVTKWDTGRMEIIELASETVTSTTASGTLFRGNKAITYAESFLEEPILSPNIIDGHSRVCSIRSNTTTTIAYVIIYTTASSTDTVEYSVIAIGRWK